MVPTVGYRTRSTLFVVRGTNLEPKNIVYFVISIENETNLVTKTSRGDLLSIPQTGGGFPLLKHKNTEPSWLQSKVYLTLYTEHAETYFALIIRMPCPVLHALILIMGFRYLLLKHNSVFIIYMLGVLCAQCACYDNTAEYASPISLCTVT